MSLRLKGQVMALAAYRIMLREPTSAQDYRGTVATRAASGGWEIDRQRGGHAQLAHPTKPGLVTVPQHAGEILKPKTLTTILEQAGLSVDDLRRLL